MKRIFGLVDPSSAFLSAELQEIKKRREANPRKVLVFIVLEVRSDGKIYHNGIRCHICLLFACVYMIFSGCGPGTCGDGKSRKPNIIFILADDMRWDEFGAAGHNYIQTPNTDRIAREGIY